MRRLLAVVWMLLQEGAVLVGSVGSVNSDSEDWDLPGWMVVKMAGFTPLVP